jgi:hypothetical protein
VGRRHLSAAAALVALASASASPAVAGITWRVLADGAAPGAPSTGTSASVAFDRPAASRLAARLPAAGARAVRAVDYSRSGVVAIFGEFGCRDARIAVSKIVRHGATLAVTLVERPLAPGTAECMAIFPTYRVLAVADSAVGRPSPTRATASLARA